MPSRRRSASVRHSRSPATITSLYPGAGSVVRTPAHRAALEAVVLSQFSAARPCDRKANRPPGQAALTERAALMGAEGLEPAVDLAQLAEVVRLAFPNATAGPGAEVTA